MVLGSLRYSVFALGEDLGIAFDDDYIASIADDAAKFAIEDCGGKSEYKKALAKNYMNDSVYRFLERYSATAAEALSAVSQSSKIPKDDKGIIALAKGDEFIRVKQILVIGENGTESVDDTYFQTKEPHKTKKLWQLPKKLVTEQNQVRISILSLKNTASLSSCLTIPTDIIFAAECGIR